MERTQIKKVGGNGKKGKVEDMSGYVYQMEYIADKDLYRAVMFAAKMVREGEYKGLAIKKAAYYYQVSMADVAHYLGQRGGRKYANVCAKRSGNND